MTCSINTIAIIDDLPRIRAKLLRHLLASMSDDDNMTADTDATDEDDAQSIVKRLNM